MKPSWLVEKGLLEDQCPAHRVLHELLCPFGGLSVHDQHALPSSHDDSICAPHSLMEILPYTSSTS